MATMKLGVRNVYFGIVVNNDKVYFFFRHSDMLVFCALIFINALFVYATSDFLFPDSGGTLVQVMSAIGGAGYLFVFALTSFSLFIEGSLATLAVVIVLENLLTLISFVLVLGGVG